MSTEVATRKETAPVVMQDTSTIMEVISRAASDPNTDIDKLERLMGLYERLESKKAETAFNAAMTDAQSEIRRISTDADNKQTRSRYATYGQLDKAIRPIYTKYGFALSFSSAESPLAEHVRIVCDVTHRDGFKKTPHLDMPADGKGAKGGDVMTKTHATGSAMRYGMRYLATMIFNIAIGDDDDGNSADKPVARLTEQQIADLDALMDEVGADKPKFLAYCKVESLDQIPADKYEQCVKAIEKKRSS